MRNKFTCLVLSVVCCFGYQFNSALFNPKLKQLRAEEKEQKYYMNVYIKTQDKNFMLECMIKTFHMQRFFNDFQKKILCIFDISDLDPNLQDEIKELCNLYAQHYFNNILDIEFLNKKNAIKHKYQKYAIFKSKIPLKNPTKILQGDYQELKNEGIIKDLVNFVKNKHHSAEHV